MFRKTQELSPEDAVAPLEFPDSEIQREEEEFDDQILDVPENIEIPLEELLEVPPSKRRYAWYQETIQEAEKHKSPPGTFRERIRPHKYSDIMSQLISSEPSSYKDVASKRVWVDAMMEEYKSIMKNDVWEVVPRPAGKLVVTYRWIYKIKHTANCSVKKYKSIFVAHGFTQIEGIDYDETFAPVARYTTIRTIISLTAVFRWKLHQMDVKTAFPTGQNEEEVYIEQPKGFVTHGKKTHVCKLKKALYGLKQAPRVWYAVCQDGWISP